MFKTTTKLVIFVFLAIAVFALANFVLPVQAADTGDELLWGGEDIRIEVGDKIGLGEEDPRVVIARVIQVALGFLGIIAVIIIMYAGWLWMTSEGNEEKINLAKKILLNAVIGMVIILSAFAIASLILNRLKGAADGEGYYPGGGKPPAQGGISATSNKIIESHYPARNQGDVSRNTKIIVTFKEAIDPDTIIIGANINQDNIKIYKSADGLDSALPSNAVLATKTSDNKTFVFDTISLLDKSWYTVVLGTGITKIDGGAAFVGEMSTDGYNWSFEVSADEDLIPPKVESVVPTSGAAEPRNAVIQINFNEPIDPTTASGNTVGGFDNITIKYIFSGIETLIDGNFYISNEYKTVEFLTADTCGINSCGQTVYCLPGNQAITATIKAADLTTGLNGLVDMAGNSLDGDADGFSQGPVFDDYVWSFSTNNKIIITSPKIIDGGYGPTGTGANLDAVPYATFNRLLLSSSLIKEESVSLIADPEDNGIYYQLGKRNDSVIIDEQEVERTIVYIRHGQNFYEETDYTPEFNEKIRDIYQNCYDCNQ